MKVGIAIDKWKLPIFERRLKAAGYTYEKFDGPEIAVLKVVTDDPGPLKKVCEECQLEAAQTKGGVH